MAFNFNWSPLAADAEFYSRAQELLTIALNKSPKPPIIVDDILVNELNLGSFPPDLEILEIGDLAEDRFRGIFKMCYSGDAFLTLKTRVQANPLNTYLSLKPSFTSPQPLAAASGLTIPLQITLSDIRLSAFIILVFSRQKGLTLVFRNDPLESLKVSSTFDSIPFVRDYLQKEIEKQLRNLMMDELPAIIHKLSLRLWCPEYRMVEEDHASKQLDREEVVMNPLESPPQDAVDARGNVLDASEVSSLSLDGGAEIHSLFSQKNLLRLAALTDSHRTLSLFTPSIRDAVFRAWAGPSERGDTIGTSTPATPSLIRSHSAVGSVGTTYTFSSKSSDDGHGMSSRPSMTRMQSETTGLSLGSGRHSRSRRKKKNRVVNLRRNKTSEYIRSACGDSETSSEAVGSEPLQTRIPEEPEDTIFSPPRTPRSLPGNVTFQNALDLEETPKPKRPFLSFVSRSGALTPPKSMLEPQAYTAQEILSTHADLHRPINERSPDAIHFSESATTSGVRSAPIPPAWSKDPPTSILEQAWRIKIAGEMARRAHNDNISCKRQGFWESSALDGGHEDWEDTPPPAYEKTL